MSSPYPAYGPGPTNAYLNPLSHESTANYVHAHNFSVDSDIGDEAYKEQNSKYAGESDVRLELGRTTTRTPSPTPSEQTELSRKHLWDFRAMMRLKYWFRREWLCAYLRSSMA